MKIMKKISALVIAMVMVLAMALPAMAETITVNRDDTYVTNPTEGQTAATGNRTYKWYEVFHATYTTNSETISDTYNASTGALTDLNTGDADTGISYYLTSAEYDAKAAVYAASPYFSFTKSADGSRYYVDWKAADKNVETMQAAANWVMTNTAYIAFGDLTAAQDGASWSASNVEKGYYVVQGTEGENLIAVTTNVTIKEKNSYPTIDKKEKDEDLDDYIEGQRGDGPDDPVKVAVGDVIDYQITVHIPQDANRAIAVIDEMTAGLTIVANTLEAKINGTAVSYASMTSADEEFVANLTNGWQIKFVADTVAANQGKDIVITFQATVNDAALITDDTQQNKVTLKYNNTHYSMTDTVDYDVYASGIVKYDGATATESNGVLTKKEGVEDISFLQGVTFKLQESSDNGTTWADVSVIKVDNKYYRPLDTTKATAETAATITTDNKGQAIFRGLDGDKKYQLIELSTLDGYNMLEGPVALTLTLEDPDKTAASIDEGNDTNTVYLTPASVTKVANNQGTQLPSTGGIGTTIFYVIGGILVVLAGIVLVTRRKSAE
jgi:fimbrial isopeptide formation D2 family protein/LPXTG-motif cell wall-anchored protein